MLTLPAGGRALASRGPDGPGSVMLLSPGRGRRPGGLTALRLGGQDYAIPQAALPYLGRGLDLSLFNVGALERAEHGGRVPRHPALPRPPGRRAGGHGDPRGGGHGGGLPDRRLGGPARHRAGWPGRPRAVGWPGRAAAAPPPGRHAGRGPARGPGPRG